MAESISRARKSIVYKYLIISVFIHEKRQARDITDHLPSRLPNGQIPIAGEVSLRSQTVLGGRSRTEDTEGTEDTVVKVHFSCAPLPARLSEKQCSLSPLFSRRVAGNRWRPRAPSRGAREKDRPVPRAGESSCRRLHAVPSGSGRLHEAL
jgi:hypothetical protein